MFSVELMVPELELPLPESLYGCRVSFISLISYLRIAITLRVQFRVMEFFISSSLSHGSKVSTEMCEDLLTSSQEAAGRLQFNHRRCGKGGKRSDSESALRMAFSPDTNTNSELRKSCRFMELKRFLLLFPFHFPEGIRL